MPNKACNIIIFYCVLYCLFSRHIGVALELFPVNLIWYLVYRTYRDSMDMKSQTAFPTLVRVFVSSTFKDMHGERNMLTRFVFPELRRRVARYLDWELSFIDLRWGLSGEDLYGNRLLYLH